MQGKPTVDERRWTGWLPAALVLLGGLAAGAVTSAPAESSGAGPLEVERLGPGTASALPLEGGALEGGALEGRALEAWALEERLVVGVGVLTLGFLCGYLVARSRSKEVVTQEQQRLRQVVDLVPLPIFAKDREGRILIVNQACADLYGLSVDQMLGRFHQDLHRPLGDVERMLREDQEVIDSGHRKVVPEHRYVTAAGEPRVLQTTKIPFTESTSNTPAVLGVAMDVTEARELEQRLEHQANHDALTGLPNRRAFERQLETLLARARSDGSEHVLCYLDLDQFKIVNDTVGHAAGDRLLIQVASQLLSFVREDDFVARLGGDEFGLLLRHTSVDIAAARVESLIALLAAHRFVWDGQPFDVGASAGLAAITSRSESAAQLLSQSDLACYTAKERGPNQVCSFGRGDGTHQRQVRMRRALELAEALESRRLDLYRQPIVPLQAGEFPPRYEILLRLKDDSGRKSSVAALIPEAERYGLMARIDRWVIGNALGRYAAIDQQAGSEMSINLSANSLNDRSLPQFVATELDRARVPADRICFEITETAAITHLSTTAELISSLRQLGCRFALDDVGTGLSSFAYLKALPIDYLKIDGSFVREMTSNQIDQAMVAAMNQVGHTMGLRTVAESVETHETLESLRALRVDFAQGFALGVPQPFEVATSAA